MLNSPMIYQTYLKVFSPEECQRIQERAHQEEMEKGKVGGESHAETGVLKDSIRNSNNYYFGETWVFQRLQQIVLQANADLKWDLDVQNIEPLQFTEYTGGGFYNWHVDAHGWPYGPDTDFPGMVRKMSFSVLMNDPDEYTGGELEVDSGWNDNENLKEIVKLKGIGDMVIFHSLLPHRVRPVTQGIRKSLVGWVVGPTYK